VTVGDMPPRPLTYTAVKTTTTTKATMAMTDWLLDVRRRNNVLKAITDGQY